MSGREVRQRYSDLYGGIGVRPNRYNMPHKGYKHSMRTYVWVTLLLIGVMSALWFVLGVVPNGSGAIPPSFALGPSDMYFHSIAIGITALLVYLVIMAFDLDRYEPNIDFPIAYRAMLATMIGAVAALFYLSPVFNAATAPVSDIIMFVALLLLADVGGALIVELYLLPAKLSGRYNPYDNTMGMFPKMNQLPGWPDFKRMDAAYWLTMATVISAFIAGIMGFLALWINPYHVFIASPAIFNGYLNWIGGAAGAFGLLIGSHSHVIGMALMVGAVAVAAKRFRVLENKGIARSVAKLGLWVSVVGIAIMTLVFILEAFSTIWPGGTPPLLFASGPGIFQLWSSTAANGMAGDDSTMFLASLGAVIIFVPMMIARFRGKPTWKDPIRMSILATWIIAYIATPLEGFFIEFHEATLAGGPTDVVFGNLQYFSLFGILMVTLAFLAMDFFQESSGIKRSVARAGMVVLVFALISGFIYAFVDPGTLNSGGGIAGVTPWGWAFSFGLLLISVIVIASMFAVRSGRDTRRREPGFLARKHLAV
jgi:hypothetical protein